MNDCQIITHDKKISYKTKLMNKQLPQCFLCQSETQSFQTLVPHSLYNKYSSSQNFYYTKDIDAIVNEQISTSYVQFQQFHYLDQAEEYLKRQYLTAEFHKKIVMLSQYYKFHRDFPVWNQRSVQVLMERYYDKLKDVDYKKIKKILKAQQNISISTHKSFSSYDDSEEEQKRSKYSVMLNELNFTQNQSIILMDLCDKIGKAFRKLRAEPVCKGNYISGERKFEEYLKRQEKKKQINLKKTGNKKNNPLHRKIKFNPKFNTRNDDIQSELKQINPVTDQLMNRFTKRRSIEKTANQTASKQEKIKTKKQKQNCLNSGRSSISLRRKISTSESCRMLKIKNMVGNENLKTINQIYKPGENNNDFVKRQSNRIISRIRNRSNSHHNLPTASSRNRENLAETKINRINTQKVPKSVARDSVIELQRVASTEKVNSKGSSSQRINKSSSLRRVSSAKKMEKQQNGGVLKQNSNNWVSKQRSSAIENILQKKLTIVKKKIPIL